MNPEPRTLTPLTITAPTADVPASRAGSTPVRPSRPPAVLTTPPTPLGLALALQRRWRLAVPVGLVAAVCAGLAAWFLLPPGQYETRALLHVAAQPPAVLFKTMETQTSGDDYKRYQKTQVAYVRSRLVLNKALEAPGTIHFRIFRNQKDPVNWLKENLQVTFNEGSELLEIGLKGQNPNEVTTLVNAVKDAYMEEVVHVEHRRRQDRFDMLKTLKDQYAETLKNERKQQRQLAESVGSDDRETLAKKQQFAMEHQAAVERELLEVQSQKRRAEAELSLAQKLEAQDAAARHSVSQAEIDKVIDGDPVVRQLGAQLMEATSRLAQQQAYITKVARKLDDPSLRKIREEASAAQQALERRRAELVPEVTQQLQELDRGTRSSRTGDVRQQLAVLEDLEKRLNAETQKLDQGNHKLTVSTLDLQTIQDELSQIQDAASKINNEVEALNVELQAPPRIRVLEDAVVPIEMDDKKRLMVTGAATVGMLGLSLFGFAFLEFLTRKIDSPEVITTGLGLQLVGALPILPQSSHRGLARAKRSSDPYYQNLLIESVDTIRVLLLHASEADSFRSVMVTSALSGEGKTSLSCHLATSLARSSRRTLLIDGDLRRPALQRLFDVPVSGGLCELLRGECELETAIVPTAIPNLDLLTAGNCDESSVRALARGQLGSLFERLKERYDFLIVDTSPILPVTDGLVIARHIDAVLFSVFRGVSRLPKVFAAYQRLSLLGVRILGAVMTGAAGETYGMNYYVYGERSQGGATSTTPNARGDATR